MTRRIFCILIFTLFIYTSAISEFCPKCVEPKLTEMVDWGIAEVETPCLTIVCNYDEFFGQFGYRNSRHSAHPVHINDAPAIKVKYEVCVVCREFFHEVFYATLRNGESVTLGPEIDLLSPFDYIPGVGDILDSVMPDLSFKMYSYTFYAGISVTDKVCPNKCTYGYGCSGEQKKAYPLSTCTGGSNYGCDPLTTSITINGCKTDFGSGGGKMPGICAYRSIHPSVLGGTFNFFAEGTMKGLDIITSPFMKGGARPFEYDIPSGDQLVEGHNCFPVPIPPALLPPPFCTRERQLP